MYRYDLRDPHIYFTFWYSPELAKEKGITQEKIDKVRDHGGTAHIQQIFHRLDGPAVINGDGDIEFFIEGNKVSVSEFNLLKDGITALDNLDGSGI